MKTTRCRVPTRRSDGAHRRCAFTIIELIVVMAIISLLAALALPAIGKARSAARRTQCQNNLRNIGMAMVSVADLSGRFPAAGNYGKDPAGPGSVNLHSWVVDVLPGLDQGNLAGRWNKDLPSDGPVNQPLTENHIPVLVCPDDISANGRRAPFDLEKGDLSYVVNGGMGFTVQYSDGVHDCPVDPTGTRIDFNANGVVCPAVATDDGKLTDKELFLRIGLFFLETWKWDITVRHHRIDDVVDGMSHTILLTENVRTGWNPGQINSSWASPNPYLTSFYIGNPCLNAKCSPGNVDYSRSNSGAATINGGLTAGEGSSPYPSSFHLGGVHFVFGDGSVKFISQSIDGRVYAALCSPQGIRLAETPLKQGLASDSDY